MPPAFQDLLVPLASVLTPNQFEAEQLTGQRIGSEADALAACAALHARGPHTVVRTAGVAARQTCRACFHVALSHANLSRL